MQGYTLRPLFSEDSIWDGPVVPTRGKRRRNRRARSPSKYSYWEYLQNEKRKRRKRIERRGHRRFDLEVDELAELLAGVDMDDDIHHAMSEEDCLSTVAEVSENQPHSFFNLETHVKNALWSKLKAGEFNREIVDKVELLVASYLALSRAVDVTHFLSILTLVIRNIVGESLSTKTYALVVSFLELDKDEVEPHASDSPAWLDVLRSCADNWSLAITNESFTRVSKLLTMGVTLGLCDPVNITLGKMNIFSAQAKEEQINCTSFIDAIFQTAIFVCESGIAAWDQRSFTPFLFTNTAAQKLDGRYAKLMELFEYAIPGNLESKGVLPGDFEKELNDVIQEFVLARDTLKAGVEKRLIAQKHLNLISKRAAYMQTRASGTMRKRPYSFFITGGSALGKTDIANILTQACGKYNDIDVSPDRCYTYNSEDSYLSGYKSYMSVFRFDDFANTRPQYTGLAPTSMLVKVINNNPEIAVMPDLESKGTTRIEPSFVTVTSNVMDLDARTYSNCPASILSRGNVHIVPTVKPRFRKEGSMGLDSRKVNDYYRGKDGVVRQPAIPDLWYFGLYTAKIAPSADQMSPDGRYTQGSQQVLFEYVLNEKGDDMSLVTLKDVINYCLKDSRDHFRGQEELLARAKGDRMLFCEACKKPAEMCSCERCEECKELESKCTCEVEDEIQPHYGDWKTLVSPKAKVVSCMTLSQWRSRRAKDDVKAKWSDVFAPSSSWIAKLLTKGATAASFNTISYINYLEYVVEEASTAHLFKLTKDISKSRWGKWTTYLPRSWFDNPVTRKALVASRVMTLHGDFLDVLGRRLISPWNVAITAWLVYRYYMYYGTTLGNFSICLALGLFMLHIFWYLTRLFFIREIAEARLVEEHDGCPEIFQSVRDNYAHYVVGGIGAVTGLYAMYKVYKNLSFSDPQGNLAPTSVKDLNERDAEASVWNTVERERILPAKRCASLDQAKKVLEPHVVHVQLGSVCCSGLILRSNAVMIPHHVVNVVRSKEKGDDVLMTCLRRDKTVANSKFQKLVDLSRVQRVGEHDLCVVNVETTGSVRGIMDLFPDDMPKELESATMIGRDALGKLFSDTVLGCDFVDGENGVYDAGLFGKSLRRFPAVQYRLTAMDSRVGMCTAAILAHKATPYIAGVHLGGKSVDKKFGIAGTPLRGELKVALDKLFADPTHFQAAAASEKFESYGKEYLTGEETHPKSPLNFMESGNFNYYGPCKGGSTFNSDVRPSPLTKSVTERFGQKNVWGPPKGKGPDGRSPWAPWRTSLLHSASPSIGVSEKLLAMAMEDYKRPLLKELQKHRKYYESEFKPLTEVQIVSGIDGKRFIDAMNMSTSKGFPLSGSKAEDLVFLDPTLENACPRTFKEVHWAMLKEFKRWAALGTRGNLVFKAALKDEATLEVKVKVRVFQAANMTLQLGMRQYYLPFARFLSQHPLLSECAVGINAHGPEMHQLYKHIRKHGRHRGYAGDYSKYDLRMPAQLIYAAFQILIDLSEGFPGFTEADRDIMRVLATEIACPMTAFNGDLIQFIGSNPSGQNLTAYINSIVNSLLHRCAFFQKFGAKYDFRMYVSLITYGDDYAGSVSIWLKYGNLDFVAFCASVGMVVTAPDKASKITQYMDCDKMDFLKRKPRWDSELKHYMGALDEMSIYKSLHCNLRSKTETRENVAASTCTSALAEWFLHGREVYEDRAAKLRLVAQDNNISALVVGLDLTYDDRKDRWIKKYLTSAAPSGR